MGWNNGEKKREFIKRELEMLAICEKQGMSKEKIEKLFAEDYKAFKKDRCFYQHVQPLEVPTDDDDEAELRNPLFQKFFDEMTFLSEPDQEQKFWWMDEIENEQIYRAICRMSLRRKMLIQLIVYEGYDQKTAAEILGISQPAVHKNMQQIFEELKKEIIV